MFKDFHSRLVVGFAIAAISLFIIVSLFKRGSNQVVRIDFAVCQDPVFRNEDYVWYSIKEKDASGQMVWRKVPAITNCHYLAKIVVTNSGTIAIEPTSGRGPAYCLMVETKGGWKYATPPGFTTIFKPIEPGSVQTYDVPLPGDSIRWKVGIEYSNARSLPCLYADWAARSVLPWELYKHFERPIREVWGPIWTIKTGATKVVN